MSPDFVTMQCVAGSRNIKIPGMAIAIPAIPLSPPLMTTWWFTRFWSVACDQCVPCPVVLSVSRYSRGGVSISWGSARCRGEVTQYYGKCYRLSPDDRKVISRQFQHKYPKLYFHNIAPNCECEDPYFIYCVALPQEDFYRSLKKIAVSTHRNFRLGFS